LSGFTSRSPGLEDSKPTSNWEMFIVS